MKWTFLVCAPLLLAAGQAVADEIYKSIDSEGRVVYSDRPPAGKAEVVKLESAPRNEAAALERTEKELQEIEALNRQRRREAFVKAAEKNAAKNAAKEKDERCTLARDRYLEFAENSRIYDRNAAGERVYYTAAEIDAERIRSKQHMEEECGIDASRGSRP